MMTVFSMMTDWNCRHLMRWPPLFGRPSTSISSIRRIGQDRWGELAHNEVLELLGRGGAGVVLKAFDSALHRLVAIKVLTAGNAASDAARKRFSREARAAAAVVHDHGRGCPRRGC